MNLQNKIHKKQILLTSWFYYNINLLKGFNFSHIIVVKYNVN